MLCRSWAVVRCSGAVRHSRGVRQQWPFTLPSLPSGRNIKAPNAHVHTHTQHRGKRVATTATSSARRICCPSDLLSATLSLASCSRVAVQRPARACSHLQRPPCFDLCPASRQQNPHMQTLSTLNNGTRRGVRTPLSGAASCCSAAREANASSTWLWEGVPPSLPAPAPGPAPDDVVAAPDAAAASRAANMAWRRCAVSKPTPQQHATAPTYTLLRQDLHRRQVVESGAPMSLCLGRNPCIRAAGPRVLCVVRMSGSAACLVAMLNLAGCRLLACYSVVSAAPSFIGYRLLVLRRMVHRWSRICAHLRRTTGGWQGCGCVDCWQCTSIRGRCWVARSCSNGCT